MERFSCGGAQRKERITENTEEKREYADGEGGDLVVLGLR